jgi:DnaJ-class molecular chaperone
MFIYYHILGLDETAGDPEIRNRYLELVKKFTRTWRYGKG